MPCLNEAETVATCITKAQGYLTRSHIEGEVIVADNGSNDGSQAIAQQLGARLVPVTKRGYGSAILGGVQAAQGRFIIIGDADDSYDFGALDPFVEKLNCGYDVVIGNRFAGGIRPNAMPFLHQYLGNPVLTFLGRLFFGSPIGDFHCGLRGATRDAFQRMELHMPGMEFASEMIVKASLLNLRIAEVPTILYPDGRSRSPHLRTWRDGWRHLRFLLLFSPRWLFLYPGMFLIGIGVLASMLLLAGPRVHSLLYASAAVIIGVQLLTFSLLTQTYAIQNGLLPENFYLTQFYRIATLERGLVLGGTLILSGIAGSAFALDTWIRNDFGNLNPAETMRQVIPSVLSLAVGIQIVFTSFFLSILRMRH